MSINHVFSHYPCNDGELSKMIWKHFEPDSLFYNWQHNNNIKEIEIINNLPINSKIIFLDVTPSINKLSDKHSYIIIDHHKNAMVELLKQKINLPNYNILLYAEKGFPEKNTMSGCMLTWKYFTDIEYPSVVYYIGSNDVWDFSNINTEPYCLGYNIIKKEIGEKFIEPLNNNNSDDIFINRGKQLIEEYTEQARDIFINTKLTLTEETYGDIKYNIIDIKCSNISLYKYLIDLSKDYYDTQDVLRILKEETNDSITYSLRRLQNNINVDNIARHYGGNGHEGAAGYTIKLYN